ncbi:endonuclease/exonuclease/phosphatase family protein [Novipirellula sp.]|uniref:endonuclease/exonuclease/phosphatase family protein n=1 Tax=Novipirellula sp. TaxID=2795430 RepID=UPI003565D862
MIINICLLTLLALLAIGSLLNLSSSPHWFIRGWDFPRLQIVGIGWALVVVFAAFQVLQSDPSVKGTVIAVSLAIFLTLWHGFRIYPYTRLVSPQAVGTPRSYLNSDVRDDQTVRIVFSNVEMENHDFDRWMTTMREVEPDVVVVLEADQAWIDGIRPFIDQFKDHVLVPQDNWYGMLMMSQLPMTSSAVHYLIQEDIPSIDAEIQLRDGTGIRLIAVHPRPPEPIRDNDSVARDAELILWAKELAEESSPVVIGGDLNDVAWSPTTRLFMRISGLLDPRRGRGLFNSFDASRFYMRFPLDHVFHSTHFTVSDIRRLPDVGSDHFPIMIELRYAPQQADEHDVLEKKVGDEEEAENRIERAEVSDEMQGDAVDGVGTEGTDAINSTTKADLHQ